MKNKKSYGLISLLVAICAVIISVVYIVYRGMGTKADWAEYEECGLM